MRFDCTSPMGPQYPEGIAGDAVPAGITLTVVGPHAYDRRWFASVRVNTKGRVVCELRPAETGGAPWGVARFHAGATFQVCDSAGAVRFA